ncbi:MAG: hypothetical protein WD029_10310, partial [Microthrixaceae bacterium]
LEERRITLEVTDAATAKLAHDGYDSAYGARPLKRLIQKQVGDRLAMAILDGSVGEGSQVTLDVVDSSFALL